MFCQCCGIEAPTKKVAFYQNVGALVMRFSKSIEGELCKSCIHQNFWAMTTKTFFLGMVGNDLIHHHSILVAEQRDSLPDRASDASCS